MSFSLRSYFTTHNFDPTQGVRHLLPGVKNISLRSLIAPILDTNFPPPVRRGAPVGTRPGAPTWMADGGPRWEWTPMVDPNDEFDTPGTNLVGASGTVISQKGSDTDNPCSHPFVPASVADPRAYDWEFFFAVDPGYESLLAPSNNGTAGPNNDYGTPDPGGDYGVATGKAQKMDLPCAEGVLGVETDGYLAPVQYRALESDRVAVFGRWIVDTGHPDFHTEIHPPLLLACARAEVLQTISTVVGRPYLVSQMYYNGDDSDGPLRPHLINEIEKLAGGPWNSTKIEAHAGIFPGKPANGSKPFCGNSVINYTVRLPAARENPGQQCTIKFCFVVRTGVRVILSEAAGDGAINVCITMNEAAYIAPPLPSYHDWVLSWDDIEKLKPDLKDQIDSILSYLKYDPYTWFSNTSDITVSHYDQPGAPIIADSDLIATDIAHLGSVSHFRVDDTQPFPICGRLELKWQ